MLLESVGRGWALGSGHQDEELAVGIGPGHGGGDPTAVTQWPGDGAGAR